MSRKAEFAGTYEKPAQKYLEWASEKGQFKYYDKAKGENVLIDLPKFLVLSQFHTVKGWNDPSQSGIYSNEVKIISEEVMEVKAFKGGSIAKGLYKEIKEKIHAAGGHYVKSIYIMIEGGEVWNLQLKGAVVQEWGESFNKCQNRFADEWVTIEKVDKRKKGRVEYTVPVFKFSGVISENDVINADNAYDLLAERLKIRDDERLPADPMDLKGKQIGNIEQNFIEEAISEMLEDEESDLPF
jgi:hypothetical protein